MIHSSDGLDPTSSFGEELSPGEQKDGASLRDVKRALRENFAATGVIDDVTARLRRQFVCELRRKGLGVAGAREAVTAKSLTGISLRERVFHSLVVDHLASNGLLQSLAVFLAETGLGSSSSSSSSSSSNNNNSINISDSADVRTASATAAALCREDVLQALPIPADSALFRRVISRAGEGESKDEGTAAAAPGGAAAAAVVLTASATVSAGGGGTGQEGYGGGVAHHHHPEQEQQQERRRVCGLLEALVGEVAAKSRAVAVDSNTQTDELGRSHKENLVSRLEAVRETWLKRSADERRAPAQDVTERMLAYQRECESRASAQMKAEREAFRERDLAALRLQMTSSHRRETEAMRMELQTQYDARVERLRETERERERRDKDRLRDLEASQFEARQNLLREMDLLRTREQEIRRSAELDARAVRAEELRLRDQATALESRAEEVRRRERESERGRESALQAARHEARQSLEVKEEGVAREREFLKQEMEAVRAERQACQEQLSQHTETSRALQESRSDVLARETRAMAVEAEADRLREQAAVYKEAYEMRREVTQEGDRAFVRLGRQELEARVRSLETLMEEERARQAKALRKAVGERDALKTEVNCLREREHRWEAEATELSQALSSAELERDRAERRAEEEECERSALDGQVEELRAALRRSRDAIEAIRLCDVEAETSAAITTAATASRLAITGVRDDVPTNDSYMAVRADADHLVHASSSNLGTGWTAASPGRHRRPGPHVDEGGNVGSSSSWRRLADTGGGSPIIDGRELNRLIFRCGGNSRGLLRGGAAGFENNARQQLDGGEWITQALSSGGEERKNRPVRRRSASGGRRRRRRRRSGEVSRKGQPVEAEAEWWSDGDIGSNHREDSTEDGRNGGRVSRSRRRRRLRGTGHSGGERGGPDEFSVRSTPGRRLASAGGGRDSSRWPDRRGGSRTWHGVEEDGSFSGHEEEDRGGDSDYRGRSRNGGRQRRSSAAAAAAATAKEIAARERVEAAELLLAEERERMTRDLEAERARLRERDFLREEERRLEREAERGRREELEVESMRRRLEKEEDKAAARAAAARQRKSRTGQERRRSVYEEEEEDQISVEARGRERSRHSRENDVSEEEEEQEDEKKEAAACHAKRRAGTVEEGAAEKMDKQEGIIRTIDAVQDLSSPKEPNQVSGTAQVAATLSTPEACFEAVPQPAAKSPQEVERPSAAAVVVAAASGIPLGGDAGNENWKKQQKQRQPSPSTVKNEIGTVTVGNDGFPVPDAFASSGSAFPETAQTSPEFPASEEDPTRQVPGGSTQAEKPVATRAGHSWSHESVEHTELPTHDGNGPAERMTKAREGSGQPDAGGEHFAQEADADETAKAQVDREVQAYREKIRQRRQQQQQQQQGLKQPVQGRNLETAASDGIPVASVTKERKGDAVQRARRRSQESMDSGDGGGGGSVSDLSEPSSTGTRGNLEVGGGQSSISDREDSANAAAGGVDVRGGSIGCKNREGAGSRTQDDMARGGIADSCSRGDSGRGSGSGSARFSEVSWNSEGSDNDWF